MTADRPTDDQWLELLASLIHAVERAHGSGAAVIRGLSAMSATDLLRTLAPNGIRFHQVDSSERDAARVAAEKENSGGEGR